ncbi:MAG: discoidin domain-containing protein, partial [Bacteroidia bacterium]
MANLALGKLPLETVWARPEEATNGKIVGYTGDRGFADANFPATYTLDLENIIIIHTIRFLLYDGVNDPPRERTTDGRKYFYSLSLSNDNIKWDTYYTTGENGYNGWQVFEFAKNIKARFVRLNAKYNTRNAGFHIVEFEVYDFPPADLPSFPTIPIMKKFLI